MCKLKEYLPIILGLIMAIIFGLSFMFAGEGLDVLSPIHLLALKFGVAALIFYMLRVFKLIKVDLINKNIYILLLLSLAEPILYYLFETIGIKLTSSSETGMYVSMVPVATTLLGIPILKEKPTHIQFFYIIMSVIGVIFMALMKMSTEEFGRSSYGIIMLFGAIISAGFFNVYSRKISDLFTPVEITYVMTFSGAVVFNGISIAMHLIRGNLWRYFTPFKNFKVLTSILYLGGLSAVVGYFILNFMLSKMEVSRTTVFLNLATVVSVIAGVSFRNEPFYWYNAVGIAFILFGVWGTNHYRKGDALETAEDINRKAEI